MSVNLLWVLLLACPLVMFFMMRGMSAGHTMDHDTRHEHTDECVQRPAHNQSATARSETEPTDHRDRIAQLEREVADLRAAAKHLTDGNPTKRRWAR